LKNLTFLPFLQKSKKSKKKVKKVRKSTKKYFPLFLMQAQDPDYLVSPTECPT